MMLPDDEFLLKELASVRLRKNSFGVYRLDHDSGLHDDQAVALALGTHWLVEAAGGPEAWISWARKKAALAEAERETAAASSALPRMFAMAAAAPVPDAAGRAPLEGVVIDARIALKLARDAAYRESRGGWR
jgi:hypothetical protein